MWINMKNSKNIAVVLVLAALFLVGCGTTQPTPWNVSITKTTPASIEVDLIGVTESEKPYWEGYNIDKYWTDGDLRRKNAKPLSQDFQSGKRWVVSVDDTKWQEWINRGATSLLVIANLPGHFDAGPADPRRIFLPLEKAAWKAKNLTLEIEIQDTMILVLTAQKPK